MGEITVQAESKLPTQWGEARILTFADHASDPLPTVALIFGELGKTTYVRMHSECLTGDILGSTKCDCGEQLRFGLEYLSKSGGVLLYLRQEGRGIGLINKIRAYGLQDQGADTIEANHQLGFDTDLRSYETAAEILKRLGVEQIRLLSNNPEKKAGLEKNGLTVVDMVPVVIPANPSNAAYLRTKKEKMGHLL